MSMMNAEKSLEYTQNFVYWSKYWENVKQLWALEILKYKQLWEQRPDHGCLLKNVLVILLKHSRKEKIKKAFLILHQNL